MKRASAGGPGLAVVADGDAAPTPDRSGDFRWSGSYGTTFRVSPQTGLVSIIYRQNEPGEFTGLPCQVYLLQWLACAGLQEGDRAALHWSLT
ncbi:MAG: hypothetical protein R3228_06620 [Halioglobus sp.]|nr:hypothetical protein [Halioglobus sp.]